MLWQKKEQKETVHYKSHTIHKLSQWHLSANCVLSQNLFTQVKQSSFWLVVKLHQSRYDDIQNGWICSKQTWYTKHDRKEVYQKKSENRKKSLRFIFVTLFNQKNIGNEDFHFLVTVFKGSKAIAVTRCLLLNWTFPTKGKSIDKAYWFNWQGMEKWKGQCTY